MNPLQDCSLSCENVQNLSIGMLNLGTINNSVPRKILSLLELKSWNLTNEIEHFVPRKGLTKHIQSRLNESTDNTIVLSAMRGMGGVGKTTLANYFIHHTQSSFKAWFNAGSISNLQSQYVDLGLACQLYIVKDKLPIDVMVQKVLRYLEGYSGWMLVYDNVEKYEDIKSLLPKSGGHVITTSRHHNWPKDSIIDIDVMSTEEAIALVRIITETQEGNVIVKELVEEKLGLLPLAISQASAYIKAAGNMSVTGYLEQYRKYEEELLGSKDMPPGDVHDPVAITWEMNFEEVIKKAPAAAVLLNICAFLDAADISEALLIEYFKKQSIDEFQYINAKKALRDYSLIKVNEKSLSIHRLVQAVLQHKMEQIDTVKKEILDFFVSTELKEYKEMMSSGKEVAARKAYLRQLFVHAQSFLQYIDGMEFETEALKEKYAAFLFYVSACFEWHADYAKAKEYGEKALELRKTIYGEQHPMVATSLSHLGTVFNTQSKYAEAQDCYEKALAMRRAIYGEQHPAVAASLNDLGTVFYRQGNYKDAQDCHEKALAIYKAIHGDSHPDVATSLNNLGNVFYRQDKYAEAQDCHEKALAMRRAIYGEQHLNVAISLGCLGIVFNTQSKYAEAQDCCEKALAIDKAIHGNSHPDVASSLSHLGCVFYRQSKYAEAQDYHEKALAMRRAIYGNKHPDVARSLGYLGDVFCSQGKYAEAQDYHEQALAMRRAIHGEQHPRVATCLNNLGDVFDKQGQYEEAQRYYEQALAMYRAIHGEDHPDTKQTQKLIKNLEEAMKNREALEKVLAPETNSSDIIVSVAENLNQFHNEQRKASIPNESKEYEYVLKIAKEANPKF